MNRLISAVVSVLLAAIGAAAGGYWHPDGVVPVGDAMLPAKFVGWLITAIGGAAGLSAGGAVPWKVWLQTFLKNLQQNGQPNEVVPVPSVNGSATTGSTQVPSSEMLKQVVLAVPVEVEHLHRCVYHLRVVLRQDPCAQSLLDKIAVKIGRVTADIEEPAVEAAGGAE